MSKYRFSTGLTETSSRKVFHDGCAKRDIFSQQTLNKNRLCLAHCALNRSFTVYNNFPTKTFGTITRTSIGFAQYIFFLFLYFSLDYKIITRIRKVNIKNTLHTVQVNAQYYQECPTIEFNKIVRRTTTEITLLLCLLNICK